MKVEKTNSSSILAIDAGGTYFKSAIISGEGKLITDSLSQLSVDAEKSKDEIIISYGNIIRLALDYASAHKLTIDGIAISTPGPFDYSGGVCLMKHKFPSLYGVSVRDAIKELMPELSEVPILFRHDANSFLAGEISCGAAQNFIRVGGITLGTGIGVAFCVDGEFLVNELGSPASDVSVWDKKYRDAVVENYISSKALVDKYQKKHPAYASINGARGIAEMAKKGDADARKLYEELGLDLGNIFLPWCERFKPQAIIFGGQISKNFKLFVNPLRKILDKIHNPPKLLPSQLGTEAALYGAAVLFPIGITKKSIKRKNENE